MIQEPDENNSVKKKKKSIFRTVFLKDLLRHLSKRNKFYISRITKAKVLPCQSKRRDSNPFTMNAISKL